jgi:hypothetical protein
MGINTQNGINPASLSVQINAAEQQVLNRKRKIGIGTKALVKKMQQQMIAPSTFLLAGGIGFLIGEITKREPSKIRDTTDKPHAVETSPLKTALSLVTSIQTLYTALPLAWMIKTFQQPGTSSKTTKPRTQPLTAASGTSERDNKSR